jgi:hypothetical protein
MQRQRYGKQRRSKMERMKVSDLSCFMLRGVLPAVVFFFCAVTVFAAASDYSGRSPGDQNRHGHGSLDAVDFLMPVDKDS